MKIFITGSKSHWQTPVLQFSCIHGTFLVKFTKFCQIYQTALQPLQLTFTFDLWGLYYYGIK